VDNSLSQSAVLVWGWRMEMGFVPSVPFLAPVFVPLFPVPFLSQVSVPRFRHGLTLALNGAGFRLYRNVNINTALTFQIA